MFNRERARRFSASEKVLINGWVVLVFFKTGGERVGKRKGEDTKVKATL